MNKFNLQLELARAGFREKDRAASIPGWPYEIGDEICIPADLAINWNLTKGQSEECSVITAFYENSLRARIFVQEALDGDNFWELHEVQWTPREALRKALQWIDQVPHNVSEKIGVNLDRDAMEGLLRGEFDSMSCATAISAALDWVAQVEEDALRALPDFPHRQIEDGRDHPLAGLLESQCANDDGNDFEP